MTAIEYWEGGQTGGAGGQGGGAGLQIGAGQHQKNRQAEASSGWKKPPGNAETAVTAINRQINAFFTIFISVFLSKNVYITGMFATSLK
jgi:hypothetical protein